MNVETTETFAEIVATEERFQLATYKKMPVAAERGEGVWIYSTAGDKYLDLYGGHAVAATGHSHPHVVAAIREQTEKLLFYSNLVYSAPRARAAEKLVAIAPDSLSKVFFCNSGTEANENAMRLARMTTSRENIITFSGGFHGRTADSISATFLGKYRELGKPNVPGHLQAEFGDIESVRSLADESVAAIMLEPIQSMAGVRAAGPAFHRSLRELCDERGIALIYDEVQTGIGRTGEWFFAGSEAAGGIATFGGGMIAMAAVIATLEAIEADGMLANVKNVEAYLRQRLAEIPQVAKVRGLGFLLGIEFAGKAAPLHEGLLKQRIITGTSSDANVLRLLPPLCLRPQEVDIFIEALREVV